MIRRCFLMVAAALVVPAMVQAQRPSNNVHTRSADAYLSQAAKEPVLADKHDQLRKALEAAMAGVAADARNPRVWLLAGQAYSGLGDYVGMDTAFARAEQLYPQYASETETHRLNAWIESYNAGVTALQSGSVDEGVRHLELADRVYRKRPEAMVTLGSVYVQEGELDKAEATFRRALDLLRGPERAKLNAEQQQTWRDDELQVSMRLANILVEQQKYGDAEKVYRDLLAADPKNTMARANLAVVIARAGRMDEAAAAYRELLAEPELGESTLFNIGVGLFRADDHANAAQAFRRAAELNPMSHEVLYNLAQSLFARSGALERERDSAPAARKQEIAAELRRLNEEMRTTAEKLHELDPTNRNVLMMLAQSQRTLGELASGADAENWSRRTLATLEKHKDLSFEVSEVAVIDGNNEIQILGQVTNLTVAAGSPISFRFILLDRAGAEVASRDITVTAPAPEEKVRFDARFPEVEGTAGWKYVVN